MNISKSANLWEAILSVVKDKINDQYFDTWFRPVKFVSAMNEILYVSAPNEVYKNWIMENYSEVLDESLAELNLQNYNISFIFGKQNDAQLQQGEKSESVSHQFTNAAGAAVAYAPQPSNYERLNEETEDFSSTRYVDIEAVDASLSQKYTFDTFVVGTCNQFAHAAAQAVAESPSKTYNPFYIYGGVGLGKTHLMHAIGHVIRSRNRHQRLLYISSEKFMNELINAIRYDKTLTFREKYRSIDVLLIDDIQFIAGKERTQEEFFHTFNALYESQKQIIISSDCPPREIPTLEERLHSRFEWGLIADIQPPDLETKVAILRRKAELENINLDDNVAFFIASKIKSNIRELEGSLVRLVAYSSLKKHAIDLELAQEVLRNIIEEEERGVSIELIQRTVAAHYKLKPNELKSKNNSRKIAVPRQVAMYLCKILTKSSLPEIGREFGNKHHTTVIHSVNKISGLYESDNNFHRVINSLITSLK